MGALCNNFEFFLLYMKNIFTHSLCSKEPPGDWLTYMQQISVKETELQILTSCSIVNFRVCIFVFYCSTVNTRKMSYSKTIFSNYFILFPPPHVPLHFRFIYNPRIYIVFRQNDIKCIVFLYRRWTMTYSFASNSIDLVCVCITLSV